MMFASALILMVGLLPVLCFLGVLFALDSYKLVKMHSVVALLACGALAAVASYFANDGVLKLVDIDLKHFSRYVSPLIEEALKGMIVVFLIRTRRVGFLVDAAILGFAVGAGFALVENLYIYLLHLIPSSGLATWTVRGFGTAIMHGGTTAIFAVLSLSLLERAPNNFVRSLWPGFSLAVLLHSAFNHAILAPLHMTLAILLFLPPLIVAVFQYSERGVRDWLGKGFDADTEMLELINSGRLSNSPVGEYLHTLKEHFSGPLPAPVYRARTAGQGHPVDAREWIQGFDRRADARKVRRDEVPRGHNRQDRLAGDQADAAHQPERSPADLYARQMICQRSADSTPPSASWCSWTPSAKSLVQDAGNI